MKTPYEIIIAPIISEKSMDDAANKKYTVIATDKAGNVTYINPPLHVVGAQRPGEGVSRLRHFVQSQQRGKVRAFFPCGAQRTENRFIEIVFKQRTGLAGGILRLPPVVIGEQITEGCREGTVAFRVAADEELFEG